MLSVLSFVLKLIIVYCIFGLLTMWLLEDVLYRTIIRRNRMSETILAEYENLWSMPLDEQLLIFGLFWPELLPRIISATIPWLF